MSIDALKKLAPILQAAADRKDWPEVANLSRQALAGGRHYLPHLFLIQALIALGRPEEADAEFASLKSYKTNLAERAGPFALVVDRYRDQLGDGRIMSMLRSGQGSESGVDAPINTARWIVPAKLAGEDAFKDEAARFLDTALPLDKPFNRGSASICTFGSCFAANLARMLSDQGMNATSLLIEETVNSTFANRVLMEVVCDEAGNHAHAEMREAFGDVFFDAVRQKLRSATHIVLTVGVAPSFFRNDDKSFIFAKHYRDMLKAGTIHMRTTTFDENAENLERVLALMDRVAPQARKIVTVSPVPLGATTEMRSVIVADCVSKMTLRAVVHEVVTADPKLTYFPAFEIVRWLSAYTDTRIYGADDGNSRHVSNWVVEFIVSNFIQRFFGAA
jgi:hypothetical protein